MTADEKITAAIRTCLVLWPYHDGPGHIVYADFNLLNRDLRWCIEQAEAGNYADFPSDHPIFWATSALLGYLLAETTQEERIAWAEDPYSKMYSL